MLLPFLLACASKPPPQPAAPEPAWTTPEGQEQTRIELVESLLRQGQSDAALHLINQLHAADIRSPKLTLLQAQALREIGLHEDAEALLSALTRRHRRLPEAHNELGILAMDRSDPAAAVDHFKRAVRLDKDNPEYANNLGFALMTDGQPAEAVEVLRAALLSDATRLRTRNNLGFALVADGREQEAYRVFRSAIPEDQARYNLGVGLELRGDLAQAASAYSAALNHNPDNTSARQALARLSAPEDAPQE